MPETEKNRQVMTWSNNSRKQVTQMEKANNGFKKDWNKTLVTRSMVYTSSMQIDRLVPNKISTANKQTYVNTLCQ